MKKNKLLNFLLFICLMIFVETLLARGGGGGGHGGGGHSSGGGSFSGGHAYIVPNNGRHNGDSSVEKGVGHGNDKEDKDDDLSLWLTLFFFGSTMSILLLVNSRAILLSWKSALARKVLNKIIATDPFWDFDAMVQNARITFMLFKMPGKIGISTE